MTPEELAVIQAAMAYRDKLLANPRALDTLANTNNSLTPTLSEIARVTHALAVACPECNRGGHTCPGDGNHIPHGATDCGQHDEIKHAGADGSCPDYGSRLDPCPPGCASGVCVAGQGVSPPVADDSEGDSEEERHLAALFLETGGEWLNYAEWLDGSQVKIVHMGDSVARVVADSGRGDVIGEFQVSASARVLPPLGPEDDGVLRDELAAECDNCAPLRANASVTRVDGTGQDTACVDCGWQAELIWVPRTWVDVRTGDRVRMPGSDAVAYVQSAVHLRWHVKPGTGTSQYNPPQPLEWAGVRVTLHKVLPDGSISNEPHGTYEMDPGKPVEIEVGREEAETLALAYGLDWWADRVGVVTEGKAVT